MAIWYIAPSTVETTGLGTRDQPFKCNAINWTPIAAGDTIYLRSALGPYNETLTIGKSGTAGNYITIDSDPLDVAKAIIDAQTTRLECITHSSKTYIRIKNIKAKNTTGSNNRLFLAGSNWEAYDIEGSNCQYGYLASGVTNPFIDGGIFTECTGPVNFYNVTGNITIKRIRTFATTANNMLKISGVSTTGVLLMDDLILDGGTVGGALNSGILSIDYGVFTGSSIVKNITIKHSGKKGSYFTNCSGFNIESFKSIENALCGAEFNAGCTNINIYGSYFSQNLDDGVDFNGGCHDISFYGCFANGNGYPIPNDAVNSGDGFSAHDTCYNINQYFCVANGNRLSGFAHVGTSAGVLYHCTYAYNGNQSGTTNRAGILINTSADNPTAPAGSKSWQIKNCIGYKNYPRELALTTHSKAAIMANYNSYESLDDSKFVTYDWGGTYTDVSWEDYHATYEANSKNEDSKVTSSGFIPYDSPCVDAAPWMVGVNDGGQADPWGKKVYGLPNIGADQGAGMPIGGIRSTGFSKHFR